MSKQEKRDKEVIVCAVADINHEVCLARGQQQGENEEGEEVKADLVKRYHSSGLDAIKDSVYIPADFSLLFERATSSEANSFSPPKVLFSLLPSVCSGGYNRSSQEVGITFCYWQGEVSERSRSSDRLRSLIE